jgi:aspartate kinase
VQKFGGSSVADVEKIRACAKRAINEHKAGNRVVVVVSAMGKTTDQLITLAKDITPNPNKREMDMLMSTGEQVSISLLAMAIHHEGCPAISFTGGQVGLVTDNVHTKARIKTIDAERIIRHLEAGDIVIVAGFQGVDPDYNITTLGRGGSDTTAVALAAVLQADVCQIFTDVTGVFTADPRIVSEARKVNAISYDEMLELASLGAKVMHSRAIEFAKKYNVPIEVRHSHLEEEGTMITQETEDMEKVMVSGVALKKDLAKVTLRGVPDTPGIAADLFARLATTKVVVDDIIQTIQEPGMANIGFTIDHNDLPETEKLMDKIVKDLKCEGVSFESDVAKVSIVGVGMRTHVGVAEKMFRALADGKINIENISTSEICIGCLIKHEDAERALRLIHQAFGLDKIEQEEK